MKNDIYSPEQAYIFGMNANVLALLTYLASFIMGLIPIINNVSFLAPLLIFFIERDSTFVKFHAMQAFLINITYNVVVIVLGIFAGASMITTILGNLMFGTISLGLVTLLTIACIAFFITLFIFTIIAMVRAYSYLEYHIPFIGTLAAKITRTY